MQKSSNAKSICSLACEPIFVFAITQICNRLSSTISFELADFCVVLQDGIQGKAKAAVWLC